MILHWLSNMSVQTEGTGTSQKYDSKTVYASENCTCTGKCRENKTNWLTMGLKEYDKMNKEAHPRKELLFADN